MALENVLSSNNIEITCEGEYPSVPLPESHKVGYKGMAFRKIVPKKFSLILLIVAL
jgi:hypothetical protein